MEEDGQNARVLRHLQKFGSITSLQAFQLYGITRLREEFTICGNAALKYRTVFAKT